MMSNLKNSDKVLYNKYPVQNKVNKFLLKITLIAEFGLWQPGWVGGTTQLVHE